MDLSFLKTDSKQLKPCVKPTVLKSFYQLRKFE